MRQKGSNHQQGLGTVWKAFKRTLVLFMVLTLIFAPGLVQTASAQDDNDAAPPDQVKTLQQLAQKGYLGDQKDHYLSAKDLNDDDVTDALVKIYKDLLALDLKTLKPGDATYKTEDLKALHELVEDKKEDVLARKVSVWKFERRIAKMTSLLDPASASSPAAASPTVESKPVPTLIPTATPIPAASQEEVNALKGQLNDLAKKTSDMEAAYEKELAEVKSSNLDLKQSNDDLGKTNGANQEQLKLVKRLLDQVQDDLNQLGGRLDSVAKKADEKNVDDTELEQELMVMHKDVRDNNQDVSILKQEVAKLDKSGEQKGQNVIDDILTSKWLAGGALVVGLTALVISVTNK